MIHILVTMSPRQVPPLRPNSAPPIDYGDRHPFDPRNDRRFLFQRQPRRRRLAEQQQQHNDSLHEPIRIGFNTTALEAQFRSAITKKSYNTATRLYLILKQILPQTAAIWKDVLRVIPIKGSITPLHPSSNNGQSQQANYYCPSDFTSSTPGGVDLWIFVTVDRYCGLNTGEGSALAFAVACERDQYDRPVTGAMDFCLENLGYVTPINDTDVLQLLFAANSTTRDDNVTSTVLDWNASSATPHLEPGDSNYAIVQTGVQVTVHETGHVLGMTSLSLPYFRNAFTGKPFTPRPFALQSVTCSNGQSQLLLGAPSDHVLSYNGSTTKEGHILFEVITPLVRQVVRNHFNCQSMNGARLQNVLNVSDCFGSFWDERLFFQEMMTPFLSGTKNILSPLTLAFLEDSSWYRANYQSNYVQPLSYGHMDGCDFVNKDCIVKGNVPHYGLGNFCNNSMTIENGLFIHAAVPQTCDPTHTYKASCDLRDVVHGENVPDIVKQYFPPGHLKIPKIFTQVNYCPVANQLPTDCTNQATGYSETKEYIRAGEKFGSDSRCVDVVSRNNSICLETMCNERLGKVELVVLYGLRVTCAYDGEIHTLLTIDEHHPDPFQVKCPKLAQVCPQLICPDNCSGRGECVFNHNTSKGHCRCLNQHDTTTGCYNTSLEFIYSLNGFEEAASNEASVYALLLIISGVIGLLWMVHITVRLSEENQRRYNDPEPSAQNNDHNDDDDKTTFQKTFGRRKVRRSRKRNFRKDAEGESVWMPRSSSRGERRSSSREERQSSREERRSSRGERRSSREEHRSSREERRSSREERQQMLNSLR